MKVVLRIGVNEVLMQCLHHWLFIIVLFYVTFILIVIYFWLCFSIMTTKTVSCVIKKFCYWFCTFYILCMLCTSNVKSWLIFMVVFIQPADLELLLIAHPQKLWFLNSKYNTKIRKTKMHRLHTIRCKQTAPSRMRAQWMLLPSLYYQTWSVQCGLKKKFEVCSIIIIAGSLLVACTWPVIWSL